MSVLKTKSSPQIWALSKEKNSFEWMALDDADEVYVVYLCVSGL